MPLNPDLGSPGHKKILIAGCRLTPSGGLKAHCRNLKGRFRDEADNVTVLGESEPLRFSESADQTKVRDATKSSNPAGGPAAAGVTSTGSHGGI